MLRFIRNVIKLIMASGMLAGLIYVSSDTFGKSWRTYLIQELAQRGLHLEFSRLILNPLGGIIAQDVQVQANYVPPPPPQHSDYIQQYEENNDIVDDYYDTQKRNASLDNMYDELQTPLLLAVLFFLFQLPFFKKYLFAYMPMLFLNDGNYNIYGFVFMSAFFAFVYYILSKTMNNLNNIKAQ